MKSNEIIRKTSGVIAAFALAGVLITANTPFTAAAESNDTKIIYTDYADLWKSEDITVEAGTHVQWYVVVPDDTEPRGCRATVKIPGLGFGTDTHNREEGHIVLQKGENFIYEFTPEEPGDILFTCWMGSGCHKNYIHVTEASSNEEKITVNYTPDNGSVKLSWNSVSNAEGYGVFKYEGSSWKKVTEVTGTSYTLSGLEAGKDYKVSIVAKIDGKLGNDYSNAITVTPNKNSSASDLYPKVQTQVKDGKIGFKWNKIQGAENYGIGVYQANKWVVKKQLESSETTWTSPKVAKGTYRLVVLAKVNGAWVKADVFKKSFSVTVK